MVPELRVCPKLNELAAKRTSAARMRIRAEPGNAEARSPRCFDRGQKDLRTCPAKTEYIANHLLNGFVVLRDRGKTSGERRGPSV
jgi:hypothetical protein